jgi:hypothetical protein
VGKAAAGALRASGFLGSTREGPVKTLRGSGRPGDRQRGAIAAEENLTVGGLGSNSGRCSGRRRGWDSRDAPWRRGEDVAGLGWGWGAAEQRVRGGAEAPSGGAEGLRCRASIAAAGTRVRVLKGVGPLLVGQRSHTGVRAREERVVGDLAGGRCARGRRRRGRRRR